MNQLFTSGGQSTGASFSFSPSNAYSKLISFTIDWFDLAVQGTLKSLLQHHISKTSILQCSAFFMVQFAHPYMTTGKTIALNTQNMTSLPWQMEIHPNVSWVCSTHSCNLTPIQHVPIDTSCISLLQVQLDPEPKMLISRLCFTLFFSLLLFPLSLFPQIDPSS